MHQGILNKYQIRPCLKEIHRENWSRAEPKIFCVQNTIQAGIYLIIDIVIMPQICTLIVGLCCCNRQGIGYITYINDEREQRALA